MKKIFPKSRKNKFNLVKLMIIFGRLFQYMIFYLYTFINYFITEFELLLNRKLY